MVLDEHARVLPRLRVGSPYELKTQDEPASIEGSLLVYGEVKTLIEQNNTLPQFGNNMKPWKEFLYVQYELNRQAQRQTILSTITINR